MQSIDLTEAVGSNAKEIDLIVSDIRLGGEAWLRAGERLVKLHRIDPGVIDKIATKHPELSHEILVNFLRIGRHEVYPPLLAAANKPGVSKLLDMPYEVQKRYAHEPIEIAVEWGKGKPKTIKKSVSLLTPREAGMVFAETGVRTIEQQAFRLRESVAPKPQCEGKNVDIGYFSLSADKDGKVTLTPCAKSSIAQPVRVIDNGTGWKSAIVVFYRTKE